MKSYTIGYKLVGSTEIRFFYQVLKSSFWVPFHWRSLVLFHFLIGGDVEIRNLISILILQGFDFDFDFAGFDFDFDFAGRREGSEESPSPSLHPRVEL